MAVYKFTSTILVEDADGKVDAVDAIVAMLNDYEDMNPEGKKIHILWDKIEELK